MRSSCELNGGEAPFGERPPPPAPPPPPPPSLHPLPDRMPALESRLIDCDAVSISEEGGVSDPFRSRQEPAAGREPGWIEKKRKPCSESCPSEVTPWVRRAPLDGVERVGHARVIERERVEKSLLGDPLSAWLREPLVRAPRTTAEGGGEKERGEPRASNASRMKCAQKRGEKRLRGGTCLSRRGGGARRPAMWPGV